MKFLLFLSGVITLAGVLTLAGCGRGGGSGHDTFGAYNALGGAHRDNDFSAIGSPVVQELMPVTFNGLGGGFLAPPLELPGGRMALLSRSDTGTTLAIILRDSLLHRHLFPQGEYPIPALAADSAGTLYAVTTRGGLNAIGADGKLLWRQETFTGIAAERIVVPVAPLALKEGVIVGNSAGRLARYDRGGRQLWSQQRGGSPGSFFAGDPELGIVLGITHNEYGLVDSVSVIDPGSGAERWTKPLPEGRLIYGPVIVGELIVVGAATVDENDRRSPFLAAFRRDGTLAWRHPLLLMPRGIAGDAEGNIYVSCAGIAEIAMGGALLSVNPAGGKRWEVNFESGVPAPPLVSAQWVYIITRNQGRTGLFTYSREGNFGGFISIHLHPDVHASMMLSAYGELVMAGIDLPAILRGG